MTTAPVLDLDVLGRLGDELGDTGILYGFLRRYLALLDERLDRLERARAVADEEAWMDTVLSLKSSSALAGARAVAETAAELQAGVERRRACSGASWALAECLDVGMASLRALAAETARQLRRFLRGTTASAAALR